MSIIHEALKKVQASLHKQPSVPVEGTAGGQPPGEAIAEGGSSVNSKKPKSSSYFLLIFLALTAAAALWFMGPSIIQSLSKNKTLLDLQKSMKKNPIFPDSPKPAQPLAKIILPPASESTAAEPKNPSAGHSNPVVFNVQGVMTNKGSTVALINGKIYERGEDIGEAKILNIDTDAITILRDGKEETIRVKH